MRTAALSTARAEGAGATGFGGVDGGALAVVCAASGCGVARRSAGGTAFAERRARAVARDRAVEEDAADRVVPPGAPSPGAALAALLSTCSRSCAVPESVGAAAER